MLFRLFSLILCFLLSRAATAFVVAHNQPSKPYSLLCDNQCLINPGCLDVVVVFFILTLLASIILEITVSVSQFPTGM